MNGVGMYRIEDLHINGKAMHFLEDNNLLLKFMLINICTGIWVGMVNFIIPVFALSLHANSVEIGLIRGLSGVGDLLLVLPAGLMIDYFGSKQIYIISCAIGGLITILLSFAGAPWVLIVMMIFYGMARSVRTTSLNASFFQYMSSIGTRKGGWYKGSMTVGTQFLAPVIGGILAVTLSFTGYFIATSLFLLTPIFIVLGRRRGDSFMLPAREKKQGSSDGGLSYYGMLLKNKIMINASITECINSAFFVTFSTFLTVMVITDLKLTVAFAAMLITTRGLTQMLVVFFGGRLLEINNAHLYIVCFVISSLGLLLLGISRDVSLLMLACAILGTFNGLMTLITFTQVGNIKGQKGKIAGVFSFGQKTGMVIGPVLGGIVGEIIGLQAIFLCFIPFFLAMALYNLIESRRQDRHKTDSDCL